MKFIVEKEVFQKLPEVCFGIVVASNVDNSKPIPQIKELLEENIRYCQKYYEGRKIKDSEEVKCYREAFRSLGINPNKYMSSIEAMLTRVSKKKNLPSINPIVDLGNAISLKYKLPIGAHDLDSSDEDFYIRFTRKGDYFIPFGQAEKEEVEDGEMVYATGSSVRTRRWIWRQSELGKITGDTKRVMFPIDGFLQHKGRVLAARDELASLLKEYFNCQVSLGWIHKDKNEFKF